MKSSCSFGSCAYGSLTLIGAFLMPDSTRNKILVDTTTTTDKSKPCVDLQMNVRIRRFSVL